MAKKKLIEEIKVNPGRYYRAPNDVIRDRRFNDEERLEILAAWERETRASETGGEETAGEPAHLKQIAEARVEIEKRVPGDRHYEETNKSGGGRT